MAAEGERPLSDLVEFYATRNLQLQEQVDALERGRTELRTGDQELKQIEDELDGALNSLRIRIQGRERAELEQEGNEQGIGQGDATSLEELKDTLLNHTTAFTEGKKMLAQYRGRIDQFVDNAMEVQENPARQDLVLGHGAQQDPGLGKSFGICCFAGVMYLLLASLLVFKFFDGFTSTKGSNPLVDAFCMTFVTTFTIGYGDILPREVFSKILCDALAVVGHVVPFIFCHYMDRIAQWWDKKITSTVESERLRLLYRVLSAIVVILVVIFSGVAGIYIFERHQPVISPSPSLAPAMAPSPTDMRTQSRFWDSFHLSVMTVTSTGYGDVSFTTVSGRSFAICWIPISVTIYSVAIAYLTRHTLRAFRVHRYITGEH